jgi:hypothetical protein
MKDEKEVAKVGRTAGPGAIVCGPEKYAEFAKIWNGAQETDEKLTITAKGGAKKGVSTVIGGVIVDILTKLRAAGIADEFTDPSQVRAFASKVRDSGVNLKVFTARLDRFKVVRAWQTSKTPSEAFEKAITAGLFDEKVTPDNRKAKFASFKACVNQLRKQNVPLKKLGRSRAAKIDNKMFIEAWQNSTTIAEVKEKLVKAVLCTEDTKLSTLKSKYNTLVAGGEKLKKLKAGSGLNELMKFAASLAEGEDLAVPDDEDEDGDGYADAEDEVEEGEEGEEGDAEDGGEEGEVEVDLDDI